MIASVLKKNKLKLKYVFINISPGKKKKSKPKNPRKSILLTAEAEQKGSLRSDDSRYRSCRLLLEYCTAFQEQNDLTRN